jgi:large repetitive protein
MATMSAPQISMFRALGEYSAIRGFRAAFMLLGILSLGFSPVWAQNSGKSGWNEFAPGVAYKNERIASAPWSVHIGRVERSQSDIEFQSVHARGKALGLATLSAMVRHADNQFGLPLLGVNGDYYQMRGRPFAGDARGLQIVNGELLSGPTDGISFWVDGAGQPTMKQVSSGLKVTWPDGTVTAFGVNDERRTNMVLYTPAAGPFTGTSTNGVEVILERGDNSSWLPLSVGLSYRAKVLSVHEGGNSRIGPDQMVLSVPANLKRVMPKIEAGAVLQLSTATVPELKGVSSAISGGPILVHQGQWQPLPKPVSGKIPYGERSKYERHPRSALGWNDQYFFLVEVDGRQQGLSVGMTLEELGGYMTKLGCTEVMNLDGGGSAMFWANGQIQNSPCDGKEREVANALIVLRKEKKKAQADAPKLASP